jgi:flavin-binding protein dodecin
VANKDLPDVEGSGITFNLVTIVNWFMRFLRRIVMSLLKVIEVLAESQKSWEVAAQVAVEKAAKTVRNIQSIYIKEMTATVENNQLTRYRVNAKISFLIED